MATLPNGFALFSLKPSRLRLRDLLWVGLYLLIASGVSALWAEQLGERQLALLYLLPVLLASVRYGIWAGGLAALGAVALLNFLFTLPHYTFFVADIQDLLSLMVFLAVAVTAGGLAGGLREERDSARSKARLLEIITQASDQLHLAQDRQAVITTAAQALAEISQAPIIGLGRKSDGDFQSLIEGPKPEVADLGAADQALRRNRTEGATALGGIGSRYSFIPLQDEGGDLVFGYLPPASHAADCAAAAEVILAQAELALQRLSFETSAKSEKERATREEMRNALLSSLSHDLRTPLAVILGGVSTLRELGAALDETARAELLEGVEAETRRLSNYVADLLQMTRLQAGLVLRLHWIDPAESITAAIARLRQAAPEVDLELDLPDLQPIFAEAALLEQAIFNLLDNALHHAQGVIRLSAGQSEERLHIVIEDQGGSRRQSQGAGLGLQICHAIAAAFEGNLTLSRLDTGGTKALLDLPLAPPQSALS